MFQQNYKILLRLIIVAILATILNTSPFAKPFVASGRKVKVAAQKFYQMYLPVFGAPFGNDLEKLKPFLSPRLYLLFVYESQRLEKWQAKHPGQKPPLSEDVFTCNSQEPPQNFRLGKAWPEQKKALVNVQFEYVEAGKIIDKCQVRATFIYQTGKWRLDNMAYKEGVDLRRLLSRKQYTVLPN